MGRQAAECCNKPRVKAKNPMRVIDDLAALELRQETVLTIGAFDGVHLGHQSLVEHIVSRARSTERLAALITFHPHPVAVLAPDRAPQYLTTPGEKAALLECLGLDLMALLPFDHHAASMPARQFMETVFRYLRVRELWVGADFALGRDREGDASQLQRLGQELGYEFHAIESLSDEGEKISSSRIRGLLSAGHIVDAARLLGRYPSLSGEVVCGAQRGRELGFPTANLEVRPERAVPADGVYAAFALLGRQSIQAVANVGVRPSFDNGHRTVEIHLFDFDQDIYGCDLVIEFVARLRPERRFADIAALVTQIQKDSESARWVLSSQSPATRFRKSAGVLENSEVVMLDSAEPSKLPHENPSDCSFCFDEIEHTADRALRIWGRRPFDLFVGAARGMYSLMAGLDAPAATHWRRVELEGPDRESLLVSWLNELLFLTETEGLLFPDTQIEILTETRLVGQARGAKGSLMNASIKAATFHDLAISRDGEGWSTVITFDI